MFSNDSLPSSKEIKKTLFKKLYGYELGSIKISFFDKMSLLFSWKRVKKPKGELFIFFSKVK
jgi:hypothetical protein